MKYRILSAAMAFLMTAGMAGCELDPPYTGSGPAIPAASNPSVVASSSTASAEEKYALNPLTGVYDLDKDVVGKRPVAVMINNIETAQSVQTGLGEADIIFENLAEGGISRLMAIYSDISSVGQIGTIRSLRYSFIDLAATFDAIPVHCGSDETYATPHLKSLGLSSFDLGAKDSSVQFREKNGKATEHTLYTKGSMLSEGISKSNLRQKIKGDVEPAFSFSEADQTAPAGDQSCEDAFVSMSSSYTTNFRYDQSTKTYTRCPGGKALKDYKTSETVSVKNVFFLYTNVTTFDDDYHTKTSLSGGEGVYISEGGAKTIRWTKGNASSPLTFTDQEGNPLTVNAGSSWICLVPNSEKSHTVLTENE